MDIHYYQYKKINKYFYAFLDSYQLYLRKPTNFNDTFECKFSSITVSHKHLKGFIKKTGAEHLSNINSQDCRTQILELFWKSSNNLGISCFTKSCDNILMWSHYADQNRGICLQFEFDNDMAQHLYPVKYVSKRPAYNFIKDPLKVFTFYATKYRIWQYENEHRLIIPNKRMIALKKHYLKSIIFGSAVSAYHKRKIKKLISSTNPEVIFFQAKEDADNYKFIIEKL
ncbi:DUF2971 domain-containing protein [Pedobacter sp. UBA4863]|uniref:DUF2971 domain-containing protein n=1 Tax=Pedobacter sp. UBA4863 TaxID=1947060 RepID=UPI0025F5BFE5|nr:DUF2971 domain-containing protein [Pedobacter sp. UBA4863]